MKSLTPFGLQKRQNSARISTSYTDTSDLKIKILATQLRCHFQMTKVCEKTWISGLWSFVILLAKYSRIKKYSMKYINVFTFIETMFDKLIATKSSRQTCTSMNKLQVIHRFDAPDDKFDAIWNFSKTVISDFAKEWVAYHCIELINSITTCIKMSNCILFGSNLSKWIQIKRYFLKSSGEIRQSNELAPQQSHVVQVHGLKEIFVKMFFSQNSTFFQILVSLLLVLPYVKATFFRDLFGAMRCGCSCKYVKVRCQLILPKNYYHFHFQWIN